MLLHVAVGRHLHKNWNKSLLNFFNVFIKSTGESKNSKCYKEKKSVEIVTRYELQLWIFLRTYAAIMSYKQKRVANKKKCMCRIKNIVPVCLLSHAMGRTYLYKNIHTRFLSLTTQTSRHFIRNYLLRISKQLEYRSVSWQMVAYTNVTL